MRSVNLLPDKQGRAMRGRPSAPRKPLLMLGAVLAVAGLGYMAYSARSDLASVKAEVEVATAERDDLRTQLVALSAIDAQSAAITARRGAVVTLASSRMNWERLMRDAVTVLPSKVWLTQLNGMVPAAAPATAAAPAVAGAPATLAADAPPQGLHLEGFGFTQGDIAQLLARLEAVPGLGTPRLVSSEEIERNNRTIVQFIIDAPVDQRAQDRPTLDLVTGEPVASATPTTATAGSITP